MITPPLGGTGVPPSDDPTTAPPQVKALDIDRTGIAPPRRLSTIRVANVDDDPVPCDAMLEQCRADRREESQR